MSATKQDAVYSVGNRNRFRLLAQKWPIASALVINIFGLGLNHQLASLLHSLRLPLLAHILADADVYTFALIPLVFLVQPRIFSEELWRVPWTILLGVVVIVPVQYWLVKGAVYIRIDEYHLVSALLVAPFVEELVRAMVLIALEQKLGAVLAIAISSAVCAFGHHYFWEALLQSVLLAAIFLETGKSLPSAIVAHLAMNIVAVAT